MYIFRGTWVVQSVKYLSLGFRSGHDLTVHGFEPHIRLHADGAEPTRDSLISLLLCPFPHLLACSLTHSTSNKVKIFKKNFVNIYLFLTETDTEHERGRGRERGRYRTRSRLRLQAVSTEPDVGLKLTTVRS